MGLPIEADRAGFGEESSSIFWFQRLRVVAEDGGGGDASKPESARRVLAGKM